MNLLKHCVLVFMTLLAVACQSGKDDKRTTNNKKYSQYVNTFIGTAPLTDPETIG